MATFIKDENGVRFYYWPIPNLKEGETSEVIVITVDTPTAGWLRASQDDRMKLWAKWTAFPGNPYIDISLGPGINLSGLAGPQQQFFLYAEALTPMTEAYARAYVSLVLATQSAAGWTV